MQKDSPPNYAILASAGKCNVTTAAQQCDANHVKRILGRSTQSPDSISRSHHTRHPKGHLHLIAIQFSILGNLYHELPYETKRSIVGEIISHNSAPAMFDSAGKYGAGLALEVLGRSLSELEITPENVHISNKLGWKQVPLEANEPTFEPGAWKNINNDAVQDISYQGIL
ncbi:MAG TPA: hypothetical protein EYQ44_06295, partial [Porticoccaceae bacterium]|nr:hypothetical protein [Porticoccaceae bacterium]